MPLKRRTPQQEGGNEEYSKLEPGEYIGRLVYVADLGLQERSYKGDVKPPCQQISLGIEILDHPVTIDGAEVPRILWTKPFNIFHKMGEKSKEFEMYRVFDPKAQAGEVANWESVLGVPCNVIVGREQGKDGREYDKIENLTAIPSQFRKGIPEAQTVPCIGDADDENNPATKALYGLAKWKWEHRIDEDIPF